MLQIQQRFVGDYTFTANVRDDNDTPLDVVSPAVAITTLAGTAVDIGDAEPVPTTGVLTLTLPYDSLPVGTYLARFTGTVDSKPQEWRVYFEIVAALNATPTELLDDMRQELRLTSTAFDAEIEGHIAAAKADLKLSGVSDAALNAPLPDPLVRLAITMYLKAMFGMDNADSEKYMHSFRSLETSLALSAEYGSSS